MRGGYEGGVGLTSRKCGVGLIREGIHSESQRRGTAGWRP